MKKIELEDITPKMLDEAASIVRHVVAMQSEPADPAIGQLVLHAIIKLQRPKRAREPRNGLHTEISNALHDGLRDELSVGICDALSAGLHSEFRTGLWRALRAALSEGLDIGLRTALDDSLNGRLGAQLRAVLDDGVLEALSAGIGEGLSDGLRARLDVGLSAELNDGLRDGLADGLGDGLSDGLRAGLHAGLHAGLSVGLNDGLRDGLADGLRNGLDAGLYADLSSGLDIGLHDELGDGLGDGLYSGLRSGLDIGLHDGIRDRLHDGQSKIDSFYCGIFWSWWLARYLIAASWGCKVNYQKLGLFYAFCRYCPIVGIVKEKNDERFVVLPKPKNIKFIETGMTTGSTPLPIFELHADGEPSAEYADIKLYHWHNVKIPERMGQTKSKNWSAKWLLDEQNAEVKRLLIQEIGYEKIMNELGAKCLDVWTDEGRGGRYELIKIKQKIDVESIVLCKMSCPSTNGDYAIRVPPNTKTAYDAITWIRHGIRPEQMICQH